MDELDPRLLEIVIEIGTNRHVFDQRFAIRAQGILFSNALLDTCEVTLFNLDRATQDYLLNATSPYTPNHETKTLTVLAGRKSYGTTLIYKGFILVSIVSQPPDIGITFRCLSEPNFSNTFYSIGSPGIKSAVLYWQQFANRIGATLKNQVTNPPMVSNLGFTGSPKDELTYWNTFGNFTMFLTKGNVDVLVVKDIFAYLTGTLRVVSEAHGMIGIPEWTELGIRVTFLIDSKTTPGGYLDIDSKRYPSFGARPVSGRDP